MIKRDGRGDECEGGGDKGDQGETSRIENQGRDRDRTKQTKKNPTISSASSSSKPKPKPRTCTHLPPKSDRLLVQPPLLRIPDIGRDDLVERQLFPVLLTLAFHTFFPLFISSRLHPPLILPPALLRFEDLRILVRLDRQLAPDRILDVEDRLVDRIQRQRASRFSTVRPGEVRTGLFRGWRWGEHSVGCSGGRIVRR